VLFTDYIFAFEITALLLTVAVIGAVVLTRRTVGDPIDLVDFPEGTALDVWEAEHALEDEFDDEPEGDIADESAVESADDSAGDVADDEVVS
jgi:hypothetical protein